MGIYSLSLFLNNGKDVLKQDLVKIESKFYSFSMSTSTPESVEASTSASEETSQPEVERIFLAEDDSKEVANILAGITILVGLAIGTVIEEWLKYQANQKHDQRVIQYVSEGSERAKAELERYNQNSNRLQE